MPKRDAQVVFRQMLDHAQEAVALTRNRTRESLKGDRTLSLAAVRLLEVLGEAANRVEIQEQAKRPKIPWAQLRGLRTG
jgi:uncharacterized protein with HEPN domain